MSFWAGHATRTSSAPLFTRLTFRGGHVSSARFSPDGHTIVYSAAFGNEPLQLYTTRPDAPQSRDLGLKKSSILAVSKQDELAITLNYVQLQATAGGGTLARVPLTGGSPRELNEAVGSADWAPDGQSLALAALTDSSVNLEYPQGTRIYETQGWIGELRISPDGNLVAFIDHPIRWDSLGRVMVVDRHGKHRALTSSFSDIRGLAWGRLARRFGLLGRTSKGYADDPVPCGSWGTRVPQIFGGMADYSEVNKSKDRRNLPFLRHPLEINRCGTWLPIGVNCSP